MNFSISAKAEKASKHFLLQIGRQVHGNCRVRILSQNLPGERGHRVCHNNVPKGGKGDSIEDSLQRAARNLRP